MVSPTPVQEMGRRAGRKAKPASPAESLMLSGSEAEELSRTTTVRPIAIPKSARLPGTDRPVTGVSPNESVPLDKVMYLLKTFASEFREDLARNMRELMSPFDERLANVEKKVAGAESDLQELRSANEKLTTEVARLASATCISDSPGNGGKSAITGLRQEVDRLATRLGEVAQSTPNMAQTYFEEQAEQIARSNNVVLRGVPEAVEEGALVQTVRELIPGGVRSSDIFSAERLGRRNTANGSGTAPSKPRPVRVCLSKSGKELLMKKKQEAVTGGNPVYVSHDLTRTEQSKRNDVWPTFRKLRQNGIRCTLPRCVIMLKGKAMTDEEIAMHLSKTT